MGAWLPRYKEKQLQLWDLYLITLYYMVCVHALHACRHSRVAHYVHGHAHTCGSGLTYYKRTKFHGIKFFVDEAKVYSECRLAFLAFTCCVFFGHSLGAVWLIHTLLSIFSMMGPRPSGSTMSPQIFPPPATLSFWGSLALTPNRGFRVCLPATEIGQKDSGLDMGPTPIVMEAPA